MNRPCVLSHRAVARPSAVVACHGLVGGLLVLLANTGRAADSFRDTVAPLFERHCVSCHQGSKPKGGLSLVSKEAAFAGGESGSAITPGQPNESLLLEYISGDEPQMPKDARALSTDEVQAVRRWIAAGATWPEGATLTDKKVIDDRWWSLAPLMRPAVPQLHSSWVRNPIDAFVLARMRTERLAPSGEASRRTLIRRVYFDLLGLPPAPEEVDAFAADTDPLAYEKLVDRLLESPRYGERWARHWLDVVHYGESHGYDKDQPRPNAWPYRDYVIRAFNNDKPYSRFVEEQLAGDVLFPGVDGIEALGFIAAGPWDLIGHVEVPETKIDGQIARHLDRDDMVGATLGTFTSLTVQCAQCHNHKFDPIPQEDYYRLQAVFAAVDRADKPYDDNPAVMQQRVLLTARQRELKEKEASLEAQIREQGGAELAELDRQLTAKRTEPTAVQGVEFGYHSALVDSDNQAKWVQVDLGQPVDVQRLVYTPCYDDFNNIGAGFGFPLRYKIELSDDPTFQNGVKLVVDQTAADVPNPGTQPQEAAVGGIAARYVRITATRLAPRQNDYMFALAELAVLDAAGNNLARGKPVAALDSIEAVPRWSVRNLVDGLAPAAVGGKVAASAETVERLTEKRAALVQRTVDSSVLKQREAVGVELAGVSSELNKLPAAKQVYAGTVHYGTSAFTGTGPQGGKPRTIRVLARGDVRQPGKEVEPGALGQLTALPGRFDLPAEHAEGARRAALARWITDSRNPLTWRSIVNRVWLYHFGRGIVDTPNDFGRMGQLPSHPELLDWLAVEFRDGGQSFKQLHRLMLTSSTYRQSSHVSAEVAAADAQNVWYSHMNRRRLEAEAVRDSVLLVTGKLNLAMYGPSFRDFVVEKPEHSPHYQYHLYDPEDPASHRRSIYRFIVRSQQQPFLAALDCADPSLMVDKRNQTITPLAALALLNNQLTVAMARHFAARVQQMEPELPGQITAAFRLAVARPPAADELESLLPYAREHGLANACRVILNLNEFVFVD